MERTTTNPSVKLAAKLSVGVAPAALLLGMSAPAFAQDAEQDPDLEVNSRVPTIVVTATKRELTLQETPVAVSVVGADEIEKAEIQDLIDLQALVPSLTIRQNTNSGNTTFFIRGFGNGSNAIGLEPSVGVFIDGVYRSRSVAAIADLPNLERVEVLRGPQSTLFGKNASAGVISVTTRKPQFELDGAVSATYGNYNAVRLDGYVTGPLTENLAVQVSGNANFRDGFYDDPGTGEEYSERNRWGVRGDILWEPSLDVSFRLIGDYDKIDEVCCAVSNLLDGPTGNAVRALGGNIVAEDPFSREVFYDVVPTNEIENYGVSLQGDFDLGFATLTSITAWRNNDNVTDQDSDFTDLSIFANTDVTNQIETFTQEVRLQSVGAGNLIDWTVGGFYFDERVDVLNDIRYGPDARPFFNAIAGNPALLPGLEAATGTPPGTFAGVGQGMTDGGRQDNTAWSIFGTVDFNITDRLTATFGISYTEDEKEASYFGDSNDSLAALNLDQIGYTATLAQLLGAQGVNIQDPTSVGPFIQMNPQAYAAIQQQALAVAQGPANPFGGLTVLQIFPQFVNFPNSVEDGMTNDNSTDFTARLSYEVTDNINVYVTYATGFKASSWNLSRTSRPFPTTFIAGNPIVDPVTQQVLAATPSSPITDAGLNVANLVPGTRFAEPEDAEVYELGIKAAFDTFSFNLTVFDQTIENFQTNVFTPDGFVFANAAEQSTFGVEVDFTWSPLDGLLFSGGATFLDPVYDDFQNFGQGIDVSGQQPQGIAETQFNLAANYGFTIGDLDAFVRTDYTHLGDSPFFDDPNDEALIRTSGFGREQNLVNLSLGITTASEIDVTLWARNLFDDEFIVFAFPGVAQAGTFTGAPGEPRTYGITLRKSF
ncbi:MAG: TonB-dependent receptor [Pseudomonadota bacterium]